MRIRVVSSQRKSDDRTVITRSSDGRIYILRDMIDPLSREREVTVSMMGSPEELIGRFSSKDRGSRIKRTPVTVALLKERLLEERWIK